MQTIAAMLYTAGDHRLPLRCRTEFKQNGPVLVIAPATSVDNWHSNWEFWGGPEVNVVSYVGSTAARALLHDHELWLSPESLDSRSSFLQKQGLPPKVNSHDVLHISSCSGVSTVIFLQGLPGPAVLELSCVELNHCNCKAGQPRADWEGLEGR